MLRRSIPLLCVAALAASVVHAQAETADVDAQLERALGLHRGGDILGAVDAYLSILEEHPDRVDARSNLGAAYVHLGRLEEAIEQYRLALSGEGDHPGIRFNLALALYKSGRVPEAGEELERVVAIQPENRNATLLLAECRLRLNQNQQVIDLLTPLEEGFGEDRTFAYLLGTALLREGDLERGQVLIDRVLSGGDSAEMRVLMGTAHLEAEDFRSAVQELGRAAELSPESSQVHTLHGQALLGMGDVDAAERAFRRALEQDPNDFEANLHLGNMRKEVGRYPEALAYLTRASRLRADDPGVLFALGGLFIATGKNEEGIESLEKLVAGAPDFLEGHALLATAYYRVKRKEDGDREREIVQRLTAERDAAERNAGERPAPPDGGSGAR
jgi:tetratricopeptide (TPR) repeat protein